jgi:hypothetical protein
MGPRSLLRAAGIAHRGCGFALVVFFKKRKYIFVKKGLLIPGLSLGHWAGN